MRKKSTPSPAEAIPTRNAASTRERILASARIRFSQHSYENVGTREIAGDAGVDAALVNRYFGGKENLFAEVITGGFVLSEDLGADVSAIGETLVRQVLAATPAREKRAKAEALDEPAPFNGLSVLLRAIGNPPIAAMVAERFQAEFVRPLAKLIGGRDAELRATLMASYMIGLATMRHGMGSAVLAGPARKKAAASAAAAIQACAG